MKESELEFWRISAAIQELFGATDEDVNQDKALREAIAPMARMICKWRSEKKQRDHIELRAAILKEIGVPVIGVKKK